MIVVAVAAMPVPGPHFPFLHTQGESAESARLQQIAFVMPPFFAGAEREGSREGGFTLPAPAHQTVGGTTRRSPPPGSNELGKPGPVRSGQAFVRLHPTKARGFRWYCGCESS